MRVLRTSLCLLGLVTSIQATAIHDSVKLQRRGELDNLNPVNHANDPFIH